jgi:hypothetical protein
MIAREAILERYRKKYPYSDRQSLPSMISAKFAVTETGEVDSVELFPAPDVRVEREIRRALDGWLFLPRLEKGSPRTKLFEVPLSFDPATR